MWQYMQTKSHSTVTVIVFCFCFRLLAAHSQRFDLVFKYVPVRFVFHRLMQAAMLYVLFFLLFFGLLMCFSFSFAFKDYFPAFFSVLFCFILLWLLFLWHEQTCAVCVRTRIAVIFFPVFFFALLCFHSKLWLSRNSCVTIGIFHFYSIHNEGMRLIAAYYFFSPLPLSVYYKSEQFENDCIYS